MNILHMSKSHGLPDYQPRLEAFHRAFAPELRAIVRSLPMNARMQVLDVGCGDGFYDRLLAERLQLPGSVTGLDSNSAYIELARRSMSDSNARCEIRFIQGKLEDLADRESEWDLAWCAQSLYSLPEPVSALKQMAKAVRPGGLVVVLENDSMHELLLPWPPELEMALRTAELASFAQPGEHTSKYYVGRRLPALFAEAGLEPLFFRTQCIDRQAPLDRHAETFLELHLSSLLDGAGDFISEKQRTSLQLLIDPASDRYLLRDPNFTMSWLNVLAWGRRPVDGGE